MKQRTWWILIGLAAVVAATAGVLMLADTGIDVELTELSRGSLSETVDDEGQTRVRDRYIVSAPVGGRLERITVNEGDRVSAADLLTRITPAPEGARTSSISRGQLAAAEARQAEASTQLEAARAVEEQARRDLDRARRLSEAGALSQDAFEQARLAAMSAQQQVAARRAALRATEADVVAARAALIGTNPDAAGGAGVAVRAPTAGRVLRVLQRSARVVDAGAPLVEIGDASGLEVIVAVLSEDAVRIRPDNLVLFDQWGGDTVLRGRVRLIEPEAFTKVSALGVEEQRVNVLIDLEDPPATLGAGYRIEAHVVTWTDENALRVPTSALFQDGGEWTVFAVQQGRAVRRTIEIGHRSVDAAEVIGGLRAGEQVILYPSALIEEGVRVR